MLAGADIKSPRRQVPQRPALRGGSETPTSARGRRVMGWARAGLGKMLAIFRTIVEFL